MAARIRTSVTVATLALATAPALQARTITVGPTGRDYAQLRDVFTGNNLAPGDVVLVDGGATYLSVVVQSDDGGSAANPVTIRWSGAGGSRPRLQGGVHTIKFQGSHHVVLDGFDVSGGSSTCVFNEANDVTVRDSVIHDCPAHGLLGADQGSGSFTLEYSEVRDAGSGTQKHALYMQADEVAFPAALFTMRFNHVHSGRGGNLLKSRHARNVVHYNWFEGAAYQELELIGPDCLTQQAAWTPALVREDSDVVGNVFVHTSSWRNVARLGGDLNGRSMGRVRFLSNTFVIDRAGAANAVLVQLGLQSLSMHNNLVVQTGSGAPAIVAENPASSVDTPECAPFEREPWTDGRRVSGSHNWVETAATSVPPEWTATQRAADPVLADIAQRRLRPRPGSLAIDLGTLSPADPPETQVPGALARAAFDPPPRVKLAVGDARARLVVGGGLDIGAFEDTDIDDVAVEAQCSGAPLPPPLPIAPAATAPASPVVAPARIAPSTQRGAPARARPSAWQRLLRWLWTLLR